MQPTAPAVLIREATANDATTLAQMLRNADPHGKHLRAVDSIASFLQERSDAASEIVLLAIEDEKTVGFLCL